MNDNLAVVITDAELPGLCQAANAAATGAQREYSRLIALDLIVMILAAILGALQASDPSVQRLLGLGSAIFIAISFAVTVALRSERMSGAWYQCRAIAES